MNRFDLYDVSFSDLQDQLKAWGESPIHADTIWHWLYRQYGTDPQKLPGIPDTLRAHLVEKTYVPDPAMIAHDVSEDRNTQKALLRFADGEQVEAVLLRYRTRYSVCVSTQVGCPCGFTFCATGQMGFRRHLTCGEIISQIIHFQRAFAEDDERKVTNVVFMGMGEPLLNYEETLGAVDRCVAPRGLALAPRRITLSTVGIVPGIRRLAEEPHPIKLAVSLHAATDALRTQLIPINHRYPLDDLFDALRFYTQATHQHIFFEWLLLKDINDSLEQAEALAARLETLPSHVNLIRLNPTPEFDGEATTGQALERFTAVLNAHNIPHTLRQRRGGKIAAGCGQLRARQTGSSGRECVQGA